MTRMFGTYFVALATLFVSSPASGQTDSENIQARVKHGQKISITDDQGQEVKGKVSALTADGLTMLVDGKTAEVPYARIVRIDRPNDSLANGALIGLGVGAALGLALVAAEEQSDCDAAVFLCGEPGAGGYAGATLLMGGLGTAVGVGIDALIHRDREIYRRGRSPHAALAPMLGHGVRGAVASVTW
jgi:Zn-dependent alcohol dehydrogenase